MRYEEESRISTSIVPLALIVTFIGFLIWWFVVGIQMAVVWVAINLIAIPAVEK